jgi:pimeloyl-ACP methyl ester carboxylesterase
LFAAGAVVLVEELFGNIDSASIDDSMFKVGNGRAMSPQSELSLPFLDRRICVWAALLSLTSLLSVCRCYVDFFQLPAQRADAIARALSLARRLSLSLPSPSPSPSLGAEKEQKNNWQKNDRQKFKSMFAYRETVSSRWALAATLSVHAIGALCSLLAGALYTCFVQEPRAGVAQCRAAGVLGLVLAFAHCVEIVRVLYVRWSVRNHGLRQLRGTLQSVMRSAASSLSSSSSNASSSTLMSRMPHVMSATSRCGRVLGALGSLLVCCALAALVALHCGVALAACVEYERDAVLHSPAGLDAMRADAPLDALPAHYWLPGKLVDVSGERMNIYCALTSLAERRRNGSALASDGTVVLEAGLPYGAASFDALLRDARLKALPLALRVCAYDRAGYGYSALRDESAPRHAGKRHVATLARELHALLHAIDAQQPLTLVGWSFGALVAEEFACLYGDEVRALVLVEPTPPYMLRSRGFAELLADGIAAFEQLGWATATGVTAALQHVASLPPEAGGPPPPPPPALHAAALPESLAIAHRHTKWATLSTHFADTVLGELRAWANTEAYVQHCRGRELTEHIGRVVLTSATTASNEALLRAQQASAEVARNRVTLIVANCSHYVPYENVGAIVDAIERSFRLSNDSRQF